MHPRPPSSCFWELTRACDFRCLHCRSESGVPTGREATTEEALDIADQLAALGVRLVVLTGGEPTAHPGWDRVARRLADQAVRVRLFTCGFAEPSNHLQTALDAGVTEFALSVDGPQAIHDGLRPGPVSSYRYAESTLRALLAMGVETRVVTQVNRINLPYLGDTYEIVKQLGVERWQVHLCQNTGRAIENSSQLLCPPEAVESIVSVLLRAARERKVTAPLHCTLGYMTAEEPVLRNAGHTGPVLWRGCHAGIASLAITPGGGVKGCTTLPDSFVTASLKERSLADIWRDDSCFPYTRSWSPEVLSGGCAACSLAMLCKAGCPSVAYGATGSVGANPYCLRKQRTKR